MTYSMRVYIGDGRSQITLNGNLMGNFWDNLNQFKENKKFDSDKVLFLVFLGIFLSGIGIILWQILYYLKTGEWFSMSVVFLLQKIGFEWTSNPTDWIGIYNLLDRIPLSFACIMAGWFLILIM